MVGHTEEVEHFRAVACFVQEEVVESVDSHSEELLVEEVRLVEKAHSAEYSAQPECSVVGGYSVPLECFVEEGYSAGRVAD